MASSPRKSAQEAKKRSAKKVVVKKALTKKAVVKKPPAKKTVGKKTAVGKTIAKKTPAKKAVGKKSTARKTITKKTPAKKAVGKKSTARKTIAKKTPAKKAVGKKTTVRKTIAKKTPAKKAVGKKSTVGKAIAKKTPAKKAVLKKTPAPKAAARAKSPKAESTQSANGLRYSLPRGIPDSYGKTRLEAIPRDPEWVFAYWEITERDSALAGKKAGETRPKMVLRLSDVTDKTYDGKNAWHYHDTEINGYANNWYVRVPEPGRSYVAEIGYLNSKGQFIVIARSDNMAVPFNTVSENNSEQWDSVDTSKLIAASQGELGPGASQLGSMFKSKSSGLPGNLGQGASDSYLGSGTHTL